MNIRLPTQGISGRFRMVVSEDAEMTKVKHDTGEFPNLITDVGLNRIGYAEISHSNSVSGFINVLGKFVVGTGSSTPSYSDTSLQSPVAFAEGDPTEVSESSSYSRGYYELVVRYQFGQGVAEGNLSEIGIQHTSASGPLWSRALVLDGSGNPTTITVRDTDFLTCYYTLRVMIPQEDFVYNVDIVYDNEPTQTVVTIRPFSTESPNPTHGWGLCFASTGSVAPTQFYDSGLVDPTATSAPNGIGGNFTSGRSRTGYVENSFERGVSQDFSLTQVNSDSIQLCVFNSLMGSWQIHFDPPLKKNNTQTMNLTMSYSWARA